MTDFDRFEVALCGWQNIKNQNTLLTKLRSCVKVGMDVLGSRP